MERDGAEQLEISRARAADWPVFESWAAGEGWNPGPADGGCFLAQDPDGFFVGRIAGRPVSAVSVVNYGETFSFLGFYLVHPDFRGQGHGYATWRAGLEHAGSRVIGLDGVLDQQDNYRRSGFQLAHRNIRYVGPVTVGASPELEVSAGTTVVSATEVERSAIQDYDSARFPAERPVFLDRWLSAPGHIAYAAVTDGAVVGYGVIRPAPAFAKIGPLFADTPEIAEALFRTLIAALTAAVGPEAPLEVALDVPEPNAAAAALAERHGMKPSFETARMYTGPVRDIDLATVYGITSFELG
ncbi:GCN5-related N-acetyltransferase [Catenulispora acidiphila DSM 44928]|uniref:GCN5-related N-acetyltransferase n=1 Tax=Catenulispora acidiphila (strain DSM 44928 / JCM 14897 / NBRC 102108 / NRRL B-24433 / ID139908) TaxID=479433 RepID=C7Q873_CATAD|nr:GNAT family N-acetyltransferase [Catenulispora acidiphila]ACU76061.1 GCN5-related N-acetyltransferase [Catenulispora acidiphila DSM 44928]